MDKILAEAAKGSKARRGADEASGEQPSSAGGKGSEGQPLPPGMVLGPDGKPCRTCNKTSDWAQAFFGKTGPRGGEHQLEPASFKPPVMPADCPPDIEQLGNHSWTLLHSISGAYPERANPQQQADMRNFLTLFGKLYPCWTCASDFQEWIAKPENTPRTEGREGLGRWMCKAHNEVNRKLGKDEFDCSKWQERWRTGWKDGRCDF